MKRKPMALVLYSIICICATAYALDDNNQSYDIIGDTKAAFQNDSLFNINKDTGMSPGILGGGVRAPAKGMLAGIAPVAGSWSFTLSDTKTRYLKLNLYQFYDAVFGSGELRDKGAIVKVTAGGSILEDRLALFVTPLASQELYRFSLTIRPGSLNGDYIYTTLGITQPGVAFGSLISPQIAAAATNGD